MPYRARTVREIERRHERELRIREDQIERLLDRLMQLSGSPMPPSRPDPVAPDPWEQLDLALVDEVGGEEDD